MFALEREEEAELPQLRGRGVLRSPQTSESSFFLKKKKTILRENLFLCINLSINVQEYILNLKRERGPVFNIEMDPLA